MSQTMDDFLCSWYDVHFEHVLGWGGPKDHMGADVIRRLSGERGPVQAFFGTEDEALRYGEGRAERIAAQVTGERVSPLRFRVTVTPRRAEVRS